MAKTRTSFVKGDPRICSTGRPKGSKSINDILRRVGSEPVPNKPDMTKLEAVMAKVFQFAVEGQSWAVSFIADRTEGKVKDTLDMNVAAIEKDVPSMTLEEIESELREDEHAPPPIA